MAENSFMLTTYVSPFKANTSANWNAVSRQIWRGCNTSVDSGDLNQAPPKQSAVCSTCIIPALPVNCQFIWMHGLRLRHECHRTYLGVTLDRTLSYREHLTKTAGKLKNRNNLLMKLAGSTWGASANTLRSSALALCYSAAEYTAPQWGVTLCSHKSGRCAVELYHASHLWYPPFYTSPMASSALQH